MLRYPLLLSSAVLGLTLSSFASAGSDSGLYVGGSIGSASVDYSTEEFDADTNGFDSIDFDDSDSAYKIFVGYNFGIIPLLDLAVEGGYVNFGEQSGTFNLVNAVSSEVDGWNAFGLAALNLGPFGLFAKMGFLSWDGDIGAAIDSGFDDSGTDPAYGIGAKFQIASVQLRAEYEWYDLDPVEIDYFSVGAAWVF